MTIKNIYVPFAKVDPDQRLVYGYATTDARDQQGEIITLSAVEKALPDYMRFGNIREMHTNSAVGVTKTANMTPEGLYIGARIVDRDAWEKVKEGVYKGFSIGGEVLDRDSDDPTVINAINLTEISIVDRPANPEALFDVIKMAAKAKDETKDTDESEQAEGEESMNNPDEDEDGEDEDEDEDKAKKAATPDLTRAEYQAWIDRFGKASARKHFGKRKFTQDERDEAAEKSTKTSLRKSLCLMSQLAYAVDQLNSICQAMCLEETVENDTQTEVPEQMEDAIRQLAQILATYAGEETNELVQAMTGQTELVEFAASAVIKDLFKREGITIDQLELYSQSSNGAVQKLSKLAMNSLDLFEKIGAKHSAETMSDVQAIHDQLVKTFPDLSCASKIANAIRPGDLSKMAESKRKVVEELNKANQTIDQLNKRISDLENMPARPKPIRALPEGYQAVSKEDDSSSTSDDWREMFYQSRKQWS